jgi:hypothetical protein
MPRVPLKQIQIARITRTAESAELANSTENVTVPAGSSGTVLEVFGDPENPAAYLIEFHLWERDGSALATVPAEFVEPKYTPEEEAVLAQCAQRASDARAEVRALDPDWGGPNYWANAKRSPTFAEWVKHLEDVAAAAQARLKVLREISSTPPAHPTDTSGS